MTQFLLALAFFIALHSIPAIPAIRQNLIALLTRRGYLVLYSIVSTLALLWVFHAAFRLDYVELWPPAPWQAWVPIVFTPIALFLLVAGLISANPASISLRRGDAPAGAVTTITRHPVLWGFLLWALSHVVANGDLRGLLLFGAFALFALFGMAMAEKRNRRRGYSDTNTSVLPFAAILSGRTHLRADAPLFIALLITAALTAWLLLGGHAFFFGADPLLMTTI